MSKKSFLLTAPLALAPLALAAGVLLATPASAASFGNAGQIRSDIAQLDRQIDRGVRNGNLDRREAASLRGQVDNLQSLYRSYARGGFNRGEIATLSNRLDTVQDRLRHAATDRHDTSRNDDRNDNHGNRDDRHDRHDRGDRNTDERNRH